jgi:hypothetical protein
MLFEYIPLLRKYASWLVGKLQECRIDEAETQINMATLRNIVKQLDGCYDTLIHK